MKRVRPERWVCQLQPPRNPRLPQRCTFSNSTRHAANQIPQRHQPRVQCQWQQRLPLVGRRRVATSAAVADAPTTQELGQQNVIETENAVKLQRRRKSSQKNDVYSNHRIAKLSALHARLALPSSLPLNALARCLIHASADSHPGRNNSSMALLGKDLLAYYTTEHLMVHYPRLPVSIMHAAQYAYSGAATLSAMRAEWGVELAAAPGPEVDRALLQFERVIPGNALAPDGQSRLRDNAAPGLESRSRISRSKRLYQNDTGSETPQSMESEGQSGEQDAVTTAAPIDRGVTAEEAGACFIRAVTGAIYLHAGDEAVKSFHRDHILSRHLQLHKLFDFKAPTQDVNRLCHREGFDLPVARLISETGRLSRSPVFVVGIFSGEDKLGEGAGASLNEGRVRAAAAAMRSWYLYSPPIDDIMKPSDMESATGTRKVKRWIPQMVDIGEVIT